MSVKIVRQSTAYVVERLGAYSRTLGVGVHLIIPFFDRIAKKVTLKEIREEKKAEDLSEIDEMVKEEVDSQFEEYRDEYTLADLGNNWW